MGSLAEINNNLALQHSIQLEKLERKIKKLHLRLTKLEAQNVE